MKKKVRDWVKSVGKQLTGRFKAMPKQHGPHLLVLEALVGPAVMGQGHLSPLLHQPLLPAAEAQLGQRLEAGQAVAAAAIKKRLTIEPSMAAGVSQPGGAAAASRLGTAAEGGPGPSQPAAGMGGAPDEDDPEVSQPAAAPAHAGQCDGGSVMMAVWCGSVMVAEWWWQCDDGSVMVAVWTQLNGFTDRSLEYLPKPLALQFKLDQGGVDTVELLVVLAQCVEQGQAKERLLVLEVQTLTEAAASVGHATPGEPARVLGNSGAGGRLLVAAAMAPPIQAQCVEQGQAKERLLVLEVQTLTEAAASVGHATPGEPARVLGNSGAGGRLLVAAAMAPPIQGQQRPCEQQVAAYGHVAAGITKTITPPEGEEGSLGPGYRTAPAQDRERMEVATAALPESPAPAGMAGAPDEGDPEVSQPAAAHAGLDPGSGQDVINLTQEGPAADQGTGAMQLLPRAAVPAPAPPPELPGASGQCDGGSVMMAVWCGSVMVAEWWWQCDDGSVMVAV
ncbi:hypothetical protein HaLaN_00375 [Haematococcus lacustris]|uniref:Uncharacterized protein n=1 Tax=Haematococcus lacustris TaxID=44745 RepID=A0A699YFV6_HAELA|nr:hypothetical protein HaLaN_00375 [Haematococcus lacustris]